MSTLAPVGALPGSGSRAEQRRREEGDALLLAKSLCSIFSRRNAAERIVAGQSAISPDLLRQRDWGERWARSVLTSAMR
jgi:hypothetical protein